MRSEGATLPPDDLCQNENVPVVVTPVVESQSNVTTEKYENRVLSTPLPPGRIPPDRPSVVVTASIESIDSRVPAVTRVSAIQLRRSFPDELNYTSAEMYFHRLQKEANYIFREILYSYRR